MGAVTWPSDPDDFIVIGPWPEFIQIGGARMAELPQEVRTQSMPDKVEQREIPSALGRMDRALGDLFEAIDSLTTRLGPVLNAADAVDSETSTPRALLSTDVGRSVDAGALAVEDAASKLRELRDRVEL